MTGVRVIGVSKSHGLLRVLQDIDLAVEPGEFTVLLGPSGCGKTTLLNTIAGLDIPDSGSVFIGGRDVTNVDPSGRGIAMVFQSYALYPTMSVRRNLSFGLRVRSVQRDEVERRVAWASQMLQIGELLDRKPNQLSGGQRQRVAIGRALVQKAGVFLFDEPLSNLDAKLRMETRVEIKRLHQELGATMLYVTHDQIEAMTLATRIAVMHKGRVIQYAPPDELYERPRTMFVAGFVGSLATNMMTTRLSPGDPPMITLGTGRFPLDRYDFTSAPAGDRDVVLSVRPENVSLATSGQAGTVEADTLFTEPMGADTLAWFTLAGQRISARLDPHAARGLTGRVRLAFDLDKVSLFDPASGDRL
ncbi:MAG: ABC transporter ATP-binding protein [Rhodospirillales bacterium]|nr:ABC transporter ATP-binding protein [Rhodospirillales bacterium]MDE2199699.1 ABC transporter ATP-binding protein [Rhodospirillales bacterium]